MSKNASNRPNQAQSSKKSVGYYTQNQSTAQPLILAVETSGRLGSAAIAKNAQILGEEPFSAPMRHSAEIFGAINCLLSRFGRKPKEIEHIYISAGPGSFTGLRIAVTLAKIMQLANSAKIVAVDTLDVIAANATEYISKENDTIDKIATILDAKRSQFFTAVYERNICQKPTAHSGFWRKILDDSLMTASEFVNNFANPDKPIRLLGEGLVYYKDKFKAKGIYFLDQQYWSPRAAKVHMLGRIKARNGQFADPLILQPSYLRQPVVKIKNKDIGLKTQQF